MGFSGSSHGQEFIGFCMYPRKFHEVYPNRYKWLKTEVKPKRDGSLRLQFGNLKMEGNLVWSYHMLIAKVDRDNQIILWNMKAAKVSRTTTNHLGAVRGTQYALRDWAFLPIMGLTEATDTVEALQNVYTGLQIADWPEVREFMGFMKAFDVNRLVNAGYKTAYEMLDDYIRRNRAERDAMRGFLELSLET